MKYLTSQQGKLKEIRQAMDLVFGWLEGELKDWIEAVLVKDNMSVILFPPALSFCGCGMTR